VEKKLIALLKFFKFLITPFFKSLRLSPLFEAIKLCFEQIETQNPTLVHITNEYKYDTFNHTLLHNGEIVTLTESQHKLLTILIRNHGRIVSYEEIENFVWYDKFMSSNALRSLMRDVRKLIGKDRIENISKCGYRIHLHG
jgi:DNA-binding response OmpR family regulator